MDSARIEIKPILFAVTAVFAIEVTTRLPGVVGRFNDLALTGVVRTLQSAVVILIVWQFGKGLHDIGLDRSSMGGGLKQGIIWSAGFGMATAIIAAMTHAVGIDPIALIAGSVPSDSEGIILLFGVAGFVGPVAEEIFFRGLIYGFFRRWGILLALFLTTLVFVLAHPVIHQIPWTQIVGGLVFALAYEVSGSLITPIVIHILGNSAIYTLSLLLS